MLSPDQLYEMIMEDFHKLEDIPPGPHLLCPKVDDEDGEDYDEPDEPGELGVAEKQQRIDEGKARHHVAYRLCFLLGLGEEQATAWMDIWSNRVEACLGKCDRCVRNWHLGRDAFLKQVLDLFDDNVRNVMEARLNSFDKTRIDRGLREAETMLKEHGDMNTAKLARISITAVLGIFEALCCMAYLSAPENRVAFNYVFEKTQQKKPLRTQGGIIPTMTYFLFDGDPYRNRFARTAWEGLVPGSLTRETWDWAVHDNLAEAVREASFARGVPTAATIQRFWEGFQLVLAGLSEERVVHSLRAMEVQPSVYLLALEHARTESAEALGAVLRGVRGLMDKAPKAFWAALEPVTPVQLAETVLVSPAFGPLLQQSLAPAMMINDGDVGVPILAAWTAAFVRSLPLSRRAELCESLLRHLFEQRNQNTDGEEAAQATCTLAGLRALLVALDGFLDPAAKVDSGTSLIYINTLLNLVVRHREVVMRSAELGNNDRHHVGLSTTAVGVIRSALALDSKAIRVEWNAIHETGGAPQAPLERQSGRLWEAFTQMLWPGRVELARAMLVAVMPLRSIERFQPARGRVLEDGPKKRFNERFQRAAAAVGTMLRRLSDYDEADLRRFCAETSGPTMQPIVASLMHGEDVIREAGTDLIKAITGEAARTDAVNGMLAAHLAAFLDAFSGAATVMTVDKDSNNPWTPMRPILQLSRDVMAGLCDSSVGRLRSGTTTQADLGAVQRWWGVAWQCINHSFKTIRSWHERIEKKTLEDFFRTTMELADKLLAQDGLLASVLAPLNSASDTTKAMRDVLEPPRLCSVGAVDMLQLRDQYLISLTVNVLVKLLRRLREQDMVLPSHAASMILNTCRNRRAGGDFVAKTNLSDTQRVEILKAMGENDEVLGTKSIQAQKSSTQKSSAQKSTQSRLEFKPGASSSPTTSSPTTSSPAASSLSLTRARQGTLAAKPTPNAASIKEARQKEKAEKAKRDADAIARAKALRAPFLSKTVPGEGSGLQGIVGVAEKSQKDQIMVGSSSEDESDDESDDAALASHSKAGQKKADEAARRQRGVLLAEKRPVKKTKIQRSAKDMRARLIPPMDVLHQAILEWDIFHAGSDPPGSAPCSSVARTYPSPLEYKQTFMPLLVYEAWRSFVTAKDECTAKPFGIRIVNRMSVDRFLEVTTAVPATTTKDKDRDRLGEGDIVLVSQAHDPLAGTHAPRCLARIWKTALRKGSLEVVYRLSSKNNPLLPSLLPGAEFRAVRITNMITVEREYAALESLQYYDLMSEVLRAEPSPLLDWDRRAVEDLEANYQLNPAQAKAVLGARENDGFTLIQGPPGTGKTKTIIALVGALMSGAKNSGVSIRPAGGLQPTHPPPAAPSSSSKKLLICAPSNAAVDELVLRLKTGVKTTSGALHKVQVLRLGRSDAINAAVRDVTLDEMVKARMDAEAGKTPSTDRERMHQEAADIKQKLAQLRPRLEAARESVDTNRAAYLSAQREFDELKRRQAHVGARIDAARDGGNTYAREAEIRRRQVQQELLDRAQVLCATLSGSGHEMFKNLDVEFETVIIDEAAQCVELSALIPLKYGCSRCVLVGDPKQLPPTVLSQSAARFGYDQSLFVRMQQNHPDCVHLLDMQYRMHPAISAFPSRQFYDGRLQDGADMAAVRRQPWHRDFLLGPYRFFDVRGVQERGHRGQSLVNHQEIQVALRLYQRFERAHREPLKIGIITPYKAQLQALRQRFVDGYGEGIADRVEFSTTDAFQGRECDVVVFSCVRASPAGGIGFMTDIRRMNVGLTRARSSLWILGDSRALVQGRFWADLIEDARGRGVYTGGDVLEILSSAPKAAAEDVDMPDAPNHSAAVKPSPGPEKKAPAAKPSGPEKPPEKPAQKAPASVKPFGFEKPPQKHPQGPAQKHPQRPQHHQSGYVPPPPFGGVDSRGQAVVATPQDVRPVIHTRPEQKKRPLDDAPHPATKRVNAPSAPRAPKKYRPPKPDTDPTAMEVLGLAPPERPPPERPPVSYGNNGNYGGNGSNYGGNHGNNYGNNPGANRPGPPNRQGPPNAPIPSAAFQKPAADPFIRRKKKPKK